jgi:hypothetical protein
VEIEGEGAGHNCGWGGETDCGLGTNGQAGFHLAELRIVQMYRHLINPIDRRRQFREAWRASCWASFLVQEAGSRFMNNFACAHSTFGTVARA